MLAHSVSPYVRTLQVPYLAGPGGYANDRVAPCTKRPNAAGSQPLGWTIISPMNDDGLVAALQHTPVKVCTPPPSDFSPDLN